MDCSLPLSLRSLPLSLPCSWSSCRSLTAPTGHYTFLPCPALQTRPQDIEREVEAIQKSEDAVVSERQKCEGPKDGSGLTSEGMVLQP